MENCVNQAQVRNHEVNVKTCVDKPVDLPVVSCATLEEERTIKVNSIEDVIDTLDLCTYALGEPNCKKQEICLPFC